MMRQASSIRNQRNKGLRLNNFLQICILTLVFFWLLYQLKHSFDKKKGPDEHRSRSLNNVIDSDSEFVVFGRKALPHDQGIVSEGKVSNEDKEHEEEESRHTMDDGIDDELDNEQEDEQDDQERGDEEAEDGDDAVNEEEKDEQVEEAEFLDDQDPEEDSSLEAHEKGYKNDDEFSSLHQNQSNGIGDRNNREQPEKREGKTGRRNAGNNSTIADVIAEENYINYNNSLTSSGSSIEKMEQEVSPIDHSKLQSNLLRAGALDIQEQPSSTRQ